MELQTWSSPESNQCMWSLWKPNPNVQDQKLFQSENMSDPFVSPDDQSIQADNEKRGDCRIVQPCHLICYIWTVQLHVICMSVFS